MFSLFAVIIFQFREGHSQTPEYVYFVHVIAFFTLHFFQRSIIHLTNRSEWKFSGKFKPHCLAYSARAFSHSVHSSSEIVCTDSVRFCFNIIYAAGSLRDHDSGLARPLHNTPLPHDETQSLALLRVKYFKSVMADNHTLDSSVNEQKPVFIHVSLDLPSGPICAHLMCPQNLCRSNLIVQVAQHGIGPCNTDFPLLAIGKFFTSIWIKDRYSTVR